MVFILVLSWWCRSLNRRSTQAPHPSQWVVLTHYWCIAAMEINVFFSKQQPRNSIFSNFALIRDIWLRVTLLALVNVIVIVGSLSMMVNLHGPSLHLLFLFTTQQWVLNATLHLNPFIVDGETIDTSFPNFQSESALSIEHRRGNSIIYIKSVHYCDPLQLVKLMILKVVTCFLLPRIGECYKSRPQHLL